MGQLVFAVVVAEGRSKLSKHTKGANKDSA
jgi:hypothetical protein